MFGVTLGVACFGQSFLRFNNDDQVGCIVSFMNDSEILATG